MSKEKILYTDEHDVVVTDISLEVKKDKYKLNGIIGYWQRIIRPHRLVWVALFLIGLVMFGMGLVMVFPASWNIETAQYILMINPLMVWAGLSFVLLSIIALFTLSEKYAVCIAVAQGEKNVIVSTNKAYVAQIVAALDKAFDLNARPEPALVYDEEPVEEPASE